MIVLRIEVRGLVPQASLDPGGYLGSAARIDPDTALAEFRQRIARARDRYPDLSDFGLCQRVLQDWLTEATRMEWEAVR